MQVLVLCITFVRRTHLRWPVQVKNCNLYSYACHEPTGCALYTKDILFVMLKIYEAVKSHTAFIQPEAFSKHKYDITM